ncbi:MAG TPA: hypothetical protein VK668_14440 [Mucilaginibacter sp.]|nr:hypothetical protein [Mucilaginibacter sp.]
MNKPILKVSILCVLCMICISNLFAQAQQSDSTYLQNSLTQTITSFDKAIDQQSRLYNGHEYQGYDRVIKSNALYPLDATTWEAGEVNYDGLNYKNVPMMYDIYKDVVVVLLYNKFSKYTLLNERVHDFTLSDHHFVRVEVDSLINPGLSTGFYDQLYGGKVEVLAKRTKTIQTSTVLTTLETYFVEKHSYYLKKGNTYYSVGSQRSFLNALKDKKKQLQQYIRDNNIRFSDDPEASMARLAAYYDHLN